MFAMIAKITVFKNSLLTTLLRGFVHAWVEGDHLMVANIGNKLLLELAIIPGWVDYPPTRPI